MPTERVYPPCRYCDQPATYSENTLCPRHYAYIEIGWGRIQRWRPSDEREVVSLEGIDAGLTVAPRVTMTEALPLPEWRNPPGEVVIPAPSVQTKEINQYQWFAFGEARSLHTELFTEPDESGLLEILKWDGENDGIRSIRRGLRKLVYLKKGEKMLGVQEQRFADITSQSLAKTFDDSHRVPKVFKRMFVKVLASGVVIAEAKGAHLPESQTERWEVLRYVGPSGVTLADVERQAGAYAPGDIVYHLDGNALNNTFANIRIEPGRMTPPPAISAAQIQSAVDAHRRDLAMQAYRNESDAHSVAESMLEPYNEEPPF